MMPTPMMAGTTDAAKRATDQIALLRIFWPVPYGASLSVIMGTSALEVAFRLEVGEGHVERLVQAAEEIVELGLVDDQRRADRDAIAHVAHEQAERLGVGRDLEAGADRRKVERGLGLLVGHDLDR